MSSNATSVFGRLPDLLAFLGDEYRQEKEIPAAILDSSDSFIAWAQNYLSKHRPSEIFTVASNCGIQLTNGQRIQLCPDVVGFQPSTGDMANPDNSISIMRS